MSVWVTAMLSHPWNGFSDEIVQRLSRAVSSETALPKWSPDPDFKSAEEAFNSQKGAMFFLPGNFTLFFGKQFLILEHTDRWSTFLVNAESRRRVLIVCRSLLHLTESKEILLLPEGTVLMDLYYDSASFEAVKSAAAEKWGAPNLNLHRIYTEEEINKNLGERVNYFLIDRASLEDVLTPANRN